MVGGTGLYLRAALAELDLRPPPPEGIRERWMAELEREGPAALHAVLAHRAPWAAAEVVPTDSHRVVRALELLDAGELEPPDEERTQLWTEEPAIRRCSAASPWSARRSTRASTPGWTRWWRRALRRRSAAPHLAGASETARKALGFDELLAGDVEAMKRRTRNYARRQLTWMRKLAGVEPIDVTGRDPRDVAGQILTLVDSRAP